MPYQDKAQRLAYVRAWRAAHPEYCRAKWASLAAANPAINKSKDAVHHALRSGRLTRPDSCMRCGQDCQPEAAHSDYSLPLDVEWLCHSCHVKWDIKEPKH